MSFFSKMFFFVEAKFTLAGLGRHVNVQDKISIHTWTLPQESPRLCDPMTKDVLLNGYLHVMMEEHRIYFQNLSFPLTFDISARRTNESVGGL